MGSPYPRRSVSFLSLRDLLAGRNQLVNQFEDKAARIGDLDEGRERVEQKSAFAELTQANSQAGQDRQVLAHELGVAG